MPRLSVCTVENSIFDVIGVVSTILILNAVAAISRIRTVIGIQHAIGDIYNAVFAKALNAVGTGQGATRKIDGKVFTGSTNFHRIAVIIGLHFDFAVDQIDRCIIHAENLHATILGGGTADSAFRHNLSTGNRNVAHRIRAFNLYATSPVVCGFDGMAVCLNIDVTHTNANAALLFVDNNQLIVADLHIAG